jgi:hypothetical protein
LYSIRALKKRNGRKDKGVIALDPRANKKAIKEGKAVEKPIYNHITGLLTGAHPAPQDFCH